MTNSFALLAIPWHIQNIVLENMNPISRFSMRQCSKKMRQKVNECEPSYKSIEMSLSKDTVRLTLITDSGQESVVNYRREAVENEENCVSGEDYFQRLVVDFCEIVANSRVTVDLLTLRRPFREILDYGVQVEAYPDEEIFRDVRVSLQSIGEQMNVLGEQMKVKSLSNTIVTHQDGTVALLSAIKAGFLEKMDLLLCREENLDQVTTTEQWNRAREVDLVKMGDERGMRREPMIDYTQEVPLDKVLHFRKVKTRYSWLAIKDAEKFVNAAIRQGDEFISFRIYAPTTQFNRNLIQQLIDRQNPDSRLELKITKFAFHVDRKRIRGIAATH